MARKTIVAIVNPAAGGGRASRLWARAAEHLGRHGIDVDARFTSSPRHATELTLAAVDDGYQTIVAVGGDGTVHEVTNGLLASGRSDARLGVVPAGTGMDFIRNIGVRRGVIEAVNRIVRGNVRQIDLGLAEDGSERFFINFAETGIGAAVVAREAASHSRLPGRASFFLASVGAVLKEDQLGGTVSVDGTVAYSGPLTSVVIANGRYFGGGMKIAPRASLNDGLLDVVLLCDFTRAQLLGNIWKIYPGTHTRHPKVLSVQGRTIGVALESATRLDLDGELYDDMPARFRIVSNAVSVLV